MSALPEQIATMIQQELPGVQVTLEEDILIVRVTDVLPVAHCLKTHASTRFDYLSDLCGVDYLGEDAHLETVYHLYSMALKHGPLAMKVRVPRDDPKQPSVVSVWRSAEFQEREAYDLYGIIYEGHPDLRRILMWDEFEGHPMRKDYVQEDQDLEPEPEG